MQVNQGAGVRNGRGRSGRVLRSISTPRHTVTNALSVSIGTLSAFVTVCLGVLILRNTRPDLPRPFRTPAPWFTCIAGALVCGAMMLSLGASNWLRLAGWTAIGLLIYVF